MGAKQSKRSVDITTTPKKGEGDGPMEGEGKVEKIEEVEGGKVTTNGTLAHTEIEFADKEETEEESKVVVVVAASGDGEEVKENGVPESATPEEATPPTPEKENKEEKKESSENLNDTETTATEKITTTNSEKKPEKEKKKKEKTGAGKWLIKSFSFSKRDKSKTPKEEKNGKANKEENEAAEATSPNVENAKTDAESLPEVTVTNGEATHKEESKLETVEEAKPAEESKSTEETKLVDEAAPVAEPTKIEEATKPVEETPKPVEETPKPVEETPKPVEETPKIEEVPKPAPEEPSPVIDQPKTPVEESKVVEEPTPITEEPKPVDPVVEEPTKEVRTEEVPPPLPTSNPPSPVTVFAESTKAETTIEEIPAPSQLQQETETKVEEIIPSTINPEIPVVESVIEVPITVSNTETSPAVVSTPEIVASLPENISNEIKSESPVESVVEIKTDPIAETQQITTVTESLPPPPEDPTQAVTSVEVDTPVQLEPLVQDSNNTEPISLNSEPVANADSLPDISTESLPSLPEPLSESLPEPMSLPPVEAAPEPLVESLPTPPESPVTPKDTETSQSITDIPLPEAALLTNGKSNGTHSPIENGDMPPCVDGALKQVPAPAELIKENGKEETIEIKEKAVVNVEGATPAAAVAE